MWLFSRSVVSDSLRAHGLQHARLWCPSLSPTVSSDSCPLSRWCHPAISSSVAPFSSCPQSFPASGSFPVSRLAGDYGERENPPSHSGSCWCEQYSQGLSYLQTPPALGGDPPLPWPSQRTPACLTPLCPRFTGTRSQMRQGCLRSAEGLWGLHRTHTARPAPALCLGPLRDPGQAPRLHEDTQSPLNPSLKCRSHEARTLGQVPGPSLLRWN